MAHYLITGATGVLGSYCFKLLLEEGHQITLLVRANSKKHLVRRLEDITKFYGLNEKQVERVSLVAWELTRPNLGLDTDTGSKIFNGVDHLIHSAASVHLNLSENRAKSISLTGSKCLLELCQRFGLNNSLKKIEFVSTVGVGGRNTKSLKEDFLRQKREFHNTYELAKSETESFIEEKIKQGLPITVHRPSMIVGDSNTGAAISFQIFYTIVNYLSGRSTFGIIPDVGRRQLDTIPVDYVARGILMASKDPGTTGKVFHLCSGPNHSIALNYIASAVRDNLRDAGINVPRLFKIPNRLLYQTCVALAKLPIKKISRNFRPLPHFLNYLETEQEFLNEKTQSYLEKNNLILPKPESYMDQVLTYWREHTYGQ